MSRRLALPIFGVLWITVLLFFWVTKKKLEVSAGPEVQTPKVRALAVRGERGSSRPGLQAPGKPRRVSGC